jgi:hypothetical protein
VTKRTRANSKKQSDSAIENTPVGRQQRTRKQTEKGRELSDVSNSRKLRTHERSVNKRTAPSSHIDTISEKSPHSSLKSPKAYYGSAKKILYTNEDSATKEVGGGESNAKGTDTDKDKDKDMDKEEDDSDEKKSSGTDGTKNSNTDEEEDDSAKKKNSEKTTVLVDDERKAGSITKEKSPVSIEKKTGEEENKQEKASPTSSEESREEMKSGNKENLDDKDIKQEDKTVETENEKRHWMIKISSKGIKRLEPRMKKRHWMIKISSKRIKRLEPRTEKRHHHQLLQRRLVGGNWN